MIKIIRNCIDFYSADILFCTIYQSICMPVCVYVRISGREREDGKKQIPRRDDKQTSVCIDFLKVFSLGDVKVITV